MHLLAEWFNFFLVEYERGFLSQDLSKGQQCRLLDLRLFSFFTCIFYGAILDYGYNDG
jgi:hypothetical protein